MTAGEMHLPDAEATERLGARLAACCPEPAVIFLHGELGAGKTTLVRGFLRERGHQGPVTSPTYTLVEPYDTEPPVYHFDLYRLGDPEEIEYLGGRDYFAGEGVCLVEWAERGEGTLPTADLDVFLAYENTRRRIAFVGHTEKGRRLARCVHGW